MNKWITLSILFLSAFFVPKVNAASPESPKEIVVYIRESFNKSWGKPLQKILLDRYHIKARFIPLQGQALILRLRLEGAKSKADAVIGLDPNLTNRDPKIMNFLAPHGLDQIPVNSALDSYKNPILLPFCFSYFAFIVDTKNVPNAPKSFFEFLKDNSKLLIPDPRTSDVGFGFLLWVKSIYPTTWKTVWTQLKPRILTMPKGWQGAYGLFLKGEAPVVLSYTTSELYHHLERQENQYKALLFDEGHMVQVWDMALTKKGAQNPAAKKLLELMVSEEIQSQIPFKSWVYPARAIPSPKEFESVAPHKVLAAVDLSPRERREFLQEWRQEMKGH